MTDQAYPDALQPQYRMHWYTVERVLGQGGFGITYLARDTNLDQLVAVKEYLPVEVASRRQDATVQARSDGQRERYRWGLERFIQEARTLARFDHPNIVRVHSVFEFNGTAYMVMRFEEGENLGALLERRGTLPERELLRILLPILDGLELVHDAGFIHRDIKPDNIHIRADGTPVLLDFGSARHALGKSRTVTILVAPGYAPFEQYYSSSENQGPWTDIYGLGATCYRAVAGTPPLDAITRSKGILGSTREVLTPARAVGAGRYSGQFLAAVDHALEFAEKDRPQTIAEWRRELLAEPKPAAPGAQAAPAAPVLPPGAVPGQRWSAAKGPVIWAVLGSVVAATAVALWLQPRGEQRIAELERRIEEQRQKDERIRQDEERRRVEEAQRQKDAQAKQEARARQDAERQRQEEEAERKRQELAKKSEAPPRVVAALSASPRKKPEAPAVRPRREPAPSPTSASRPPPTVLPGEAEPSEAPPVVAMAKPAEAPAPIPQAEQVAKGEGALARGDYAVALDIFRPLAEGGNTRAQVGLAEMYASGHGVKRNYNQAYIWYSLAARGGNTAAAAGRAKMAALLQPAEVKQADKVVDTMRAR